MKAHKKVLIIAVSAILSSALLLANAMPAMADEVIEQTVEADVTEDNTENITENITETDTKDNSKDTLEELNNENTESDVSESEISKSEEETIQPKIIETVNNWNKHEPNNELVISKDKLEGTVIAGKMTANQPMVIWTENPLSVEEQERVFNSLKGNPGVGNPKDVVYINGNEASMYGMTVDSENGIISFDKQSNWSLIFAGEYSVRESENSQESGILSDPEEKTDADTLPELEEHPNTDDNPEIQPGSEDKSEPSLKPETNNNPPQTSGNGSGTGTGGSGASRSGGSSSGGPGLSHALDDQPETGLLDAAKGRVLDEVPKTGMPIEFSILLIISVISLITLVITLIAERKIANRDK